MRDTSDEYLPAARAPDVLGELADACKLAADALSAPVEVVDDWPLPVDAPPPTNGAADDCRLPADVSLDRGEVMVKCQLPVDAPPIRRGKTPNSQMPPHQTKSALRCGRGNARPVDISLVNRISPSEIDPGSLLFEQNQPHAPTASNVPAEIVETLVNQRHAPTASDVPAEVVES